MIKHKKRIGIIVLVIFSLILLTQTTLAFNNTSVFQKVEYTEEYKNWLELSEEERSKVMQPRMYEIVPTYTLPDNIIYKLRTLGASTSPTFNLKDIIPANLIIKDQGQTNSCWAFAAISSLETNLAMADYKQGISTKVYDYSERHMEYATNKYFANNAENEDGYNRRVGDGGNWPMAESYLTNGLGAISESEMPFENNEDLININEIRNKVVSSQVYDTVDFPDYSRQTGDEREATMNAIKQHIQNYGSVFASIHGNSSSLSSFTCYNAATSAKYCNNSILHGADHGVSIIGWNDNFDKNDFAGDNKPTSNGAWIIRNSWGEDIGDNGLIYVSYEDCNISKTLFGIAKAKDEIDYENIYQYDRYFPAGTISVSSSRITLCNIFNKKSAGNEYITQVSLYAPETYECKVYVNPNGASKAANDMQLVELKAGQSETVNAGYHTLEFAEPLKITGSQFAVAIAIEGTRNNTIYFQLECKVDNVAEFDNVSVESEKCFVGLSNNIGDCEWNDLGHLSSTFTSVPDGDSTIKAFTVSSVYTNELLNIEITTPPNKTTYYEGENFDKTGMVVTANYDSKTNPTVVLDESSYSITNGNNLNKDQNSVTIQFEEKTVEQPITVQENSITGINIKTPPTKTEYKEGQNFDNSGMVVEATYENGDRRTITDYTITNGNNLKTTQTYVTISYEGQTVNQPITVAPNSLIEIYISKAPNKTNYIVGQNFDNAGMKVKGRFEDNSEVEIYDYTIENGTNLTIDQTSVTIGYEGKTAKQPITVEEKSVAEISMNRVPTKTEYIQNEEELNLSGGSINVKYNDNSTEEIDLTSNLVHVSGFDNSIIGRNVITVEYESKTTTFNVSIIEKPGSVEDEQPHNSDYSNAICVLNGAKLYMYTISDKEEYYLINITIDNISMNNDNDSIEYYYYLSENQNESNITKWVKIENVNVNNNKINFTIDSNDIDNAEEIASAEKIYVYIKEVAIKGSNQSVEISDAIEISADTDAEIELYVNDEKVDETLEENTNTNKPTTNNNNNIDNTTATGRIPQTGIIGLPIIIIGITLLCTVSYIRYKKINNLIK